MRPLGLKRALANLIDNAVHHGSVVAVRLVETPQTITIAVLDDGPGLPEDRLDEVLAPFVRLDTARPRDTVGFGLGLAIAARAAEQEGGRLRLSNRPEGGLCSEITLPR